MRILHTADIHLKEHEDDRWKVLQKLIELGKEKGIQVLVISGDLFDQGTDAENLRPKIREIFSSTGFKIVLIPGNHDRESYRSEMWFGEDVTVLSSLAVPFECQNVRIWGMPFEPIEGEKILHRLRSLGQNLTEDKKNILLYHGELLDAFFSRRDFGDEGPERYMPVKLSYFRDLRLDCILAGHFHSTFKIWRLENGGYFVYPGSPISITKREMGQRKVNIFELGQPPEEYRLVSPYFEKVTVEFDPFRDLHPVETVRRRFDSLQEQAKAILTLKGLLNGQAIGMGEKELVKEIKKAVAERCVVEHYEFRDVQVILEDDLVKRFMQKLEQTGYEEEKRRALRDRAIRALMDSRQ